MSLTLNAQGVLLDVEGTTSAVAYVYDVMFPFARHRLKGYVSDHWQDDSFRPVRDRFAQDDGRLVESPAALSAEAIRLMDGDVKATGLKLLQGPMGESGFRSGELRAHVYPDVPVALSSWRESGIDLRVYSSGSVLAQRLFFGHSEAGDLLSHFTGHYDTTIGAKREASSYRTIAADWALDAPAILFLSDVTEELDAARQAGFQTGLVCRPGNASPTPTDPPHTAITSFDDVRLG